MRNSDVLRVVASIKIRPVYECKCGTRSAGSTIRVEVDGDADCLAGAVRNQRLDATHMPVGWASFYSADGADFRCPGCL